jgi:translocation and assembly module TamB
VRFDEKNPLFPELNIAGTTRMRGYEIAVAITGPFNEPTIAFSSSPPLPADQLVILVTTGKPPESQADVSDRDAIFTVAKYLGMDLIRKLFGKPDIEAEESILDRFELETGRNVSRAGVETIEARFRLTDDILGAGEAIYLTGERDEFEHYDVGLRIVFRGR